MSALRIGALVLFLIADNSFVDAQSFHWTRNGETTNWS